MTQVRRHTLHSVKPVTRSSEHQKFRSLPCLFPVAKDVGTTRCCLESNYAVHTAAKGCSEQWLGVALTVSGQLKARIHAGLWCGGGSSRGRTRSLPHTTVLKIHVDSRWAKQVKPTVMNIAEKSRTVFCLVTILVQAWKRARVRC